MSIYKFHDAPEAAAACGRHILERLTAAIGEGRSPALAVSGGSSPRLMFEYFGRTPFAWDQVHLFWVDERVVPIADSQSNYKLALDHWLAPAKFPEANVHRVQTEAGPREAARLYREEIRRHFQLKDGELPRFDIIHRGMGPDGHTASLFPGEPLIEDRTGIADAVWAPKMNQWRVTLLPGVLEAARETEMLVTGADKTAMLQAVLDGEYKPQQYPTQIGTWHRLEPVHWFLDQAAAAELPA